MTLSIRPPSLGAWAWLASLCWGRQIDPPCRGSLISSDKSGGYGRSPEKRESAEEENHSGVLFGDRFRHGRLANMCSQQVGPAAVGGLPRRPSVRGRGT